jgi:hypothetical protein
MDAPTMPPPAKRRRREAGAGAGAAASAAAAAEHALGRLGAGAARARRGASVAASAAAPRFAARVAEEAAAAGVRAAATSGARLFFGIARGGRSVSKPWDKSSASKTLTHFAEGTFGAGAALSLHSGRQGVEGIAARHQLSVVELQVWAGWTSQAMRAYTGAGASVEAMLPVARKLTGHGTPHELTAVRYAGHYGHAPQTGLPHPQGWPRLLAYAKLVVAAFVGAGPSGVSGAARVEAAVAGGFDGVVALIVSALPPWQVPPPRFVAADPAADAPTPPAFVPAPVSPSRLPFFGAAAAAASAASAAVSATSAAVAAATASPTAAAAQMVAAGVDALHSVYGQARQLLELAARASVASAASASSGIPTKPELPSPSDVVKCTEPASLANLWAAWHGKWRGRFEGLPPVANFRLRGIWRELPPQSPEAKASANLFLRYQVAAAEVERIVAEARRLRGAAAGAALPATLLGPGQLDDDDRAVIAALDASYTTGRRMGAAPNPEELYKAARQRQRRNAPADGADAALAAQRLKSKRDKQVQARAHPAAVESAAAAAV